MCWRKHTPRALRCLSRASPEPLSATLVLVRTWIKRDRSTAAGVLVDFHSPNFTWSVRKAESLEQHLPPLVRGMKTGRPQHCPLLTAAPPSLAFLNTRPNHSEKSRGTATADARAAAAESHIAEFKPARCRRTERVPWVKTRRPNQPSPACRDLRL